MLLPKVGIVALNYKKKFVFKIVISPEIELSIKCKTTEPVFLSLSVRHARFLDHTNFGLHYFWLTLYFPVLTYEAYSVINFNDAIIFKSF